MFYLRLQHVRTGKTEWEQAHYFWTKIFALTFAMGVVSGITMSFQFGTNWPGFMEKTGNISGPLLGYEVLTAFFLEATFLCDAVRQTARVAQGALDGHFSGGFWHHAFGLLDFGAEQLDANPPGI